MTKNFIVDSSEDASVTYSKECLQHDSIRNMMHNYKLRINHELKTPLVGIIGACQLIQNEHKNQLPFNVAVLIDIIDECSQKLKDFIIELLSTLE